MWPFWHPFRKASLTICKTANLTYNYTPKHYPYPFIHKYCTQFFFISLKHSKSVQSSLKLWKSCKWTTCYKSPKIVILANIEHVITIEPLHRSWWNYLVVFSQLIDLLYRWIFVNCINWHLANSRWKVVIKRLFANLIPLPLFVQKKTCDIISYFLAWALIYNYTLTIYTFWAY